ncbi:MAG TPA: glycoside-pentoside-hexuronide (GPH):cation symporter [Chitinispirillaceae bacterium]|nr:glycoside-pentoside-hexuronide (GPH):cation symporter [Chitinispirillaceae bacterium]
MEKCVDSQLIQADKLTLKTKVAYGVGDVGNALINSSVQFFLLFFYTDVALVKPSLASTALIVAKLWDALNDPIFGWISDKVNVKFGKRRIFMVAGAVPLAVSTSLLWFVPQMNSSVLVFIWIAATFIAWDTLWTITNVPYYALSGELTEDYDERSSLTTWRMLFAVPAYIAGVVLTPVISGAFHSKKSGYLMVGVFFGIVAALSLFFSALNMKEKEQKKVKKEKVPFKTIYRDVIKNRPFLQLIAAYGICNLGFALVKVLMAYVLKYQFQMESKVSLVMGLLLTTVAVFLVPWKMIAERLDKGPAYAIGLVIAAAAMISLFYLPGRESLFVYVVAIIAGIGFSANWVFPWSMVPDVVEYDQVQSGQHRCGLYFGIWGFVFKVSELLGIAITGWVLDIFKYSPNVVQSEFTLFGIKLFFGPVAAFLILMAAPLLFWYPITRQKHMELRSVLNNTTA